MTAPYQLICLVMALVLFVIGAGWPPPGEPHRTRIISAGLFFWILSLLVGGK